MRQPADSDTGGEASNLSGVLDHLDQAAADGARTRLEAVVAAIGPTAYAPLLLAPALLALTPAGVVPGLPTAMGVVVVLIAGQLVLGRARPWLPRWLLRLSIKTATLRTGVRAARKPARVADRLLRPRLSALTTRPAQRLSAGVIVLVALAMPPLELAPFAVFFPALAITAYALGLVARDGLLVLAALLFSAASLGLVGYAVLR